MNAETVARALGGRKAGGGWTARCPAHDDRNPTWAALSTSGLRALDLPRDVRDVIVLADGDDAGEMAARDCASRWKRKGRRVRIARPPQGMDFNDLLSGHVLRIKECAL